MTTATINRICRLYASWIGYDPRADDPAGFDPVETLQTLREWRTECAS